MDLSREVLVASPLRAARRYLTGVKSLRLTITTLRDGGVRQGLIGARASASQRKAFTALIETMPETHNPAKSGSDAVVHAEGESGYTN
ncbi:MAG: hypothetical protein LM590_04640 [Thermofilum sp.]|jgi:hypothetical protein|nr:hypothetical protein [Thermofilum sp.]